MSVLLQSTCSPLDIGCILEDGYGGFVPDGYYSNGVTWYLVSGGEGLVIDLGPCVTTTTTIDSIPCGTTSSYTGGPGYPLSEIVSLGNDIGSTVFNFQAFTAPDRFIVSWNGGVVIDTGYRGGSQYDFGGGSSRTDFNSSLTGDIDPITLIAYPDFVNFPDDGYPRVTSPGAGTTSFNKTLASPIDAYIDVYAPLFGTQWEYTLNCPIVVPTTTTTLPPGDITYSGFFELVVDPTSQKAFRAIDVSITGGNFPLTNVAIGASSGTINVNGIISTGDKALKIGVPPNPTPSVVAEIVSNSIGAVSSNAVISTDTSSGYLKLIVTPTTYPSTVQLAGTLTVKYIQTYISFTLAYSPINGDTACSNYGAGSTNVYFAAPGSTLTEGTILYTDSALTMTVTDGYYSNGVKSWSTSIGSGDLQTEASCPVTTTTTAYPYGDFKLDPQYGINITSLTASTGTLPAFSFPRNSGSSQTLNMVSAYSNGTIFTVGISGTRQFGTNKLVTLYVNSISRACQVINSDGPQTKSLTSSVAILDTDDVRIGIDNAVSC